MSKKAVTISAGSIKRLAKKMQEIAHPERDFEIIEATIKDDFCNYQYHVTNGVGIGDKHGVTGAGIVKDDMLEAFAKFRVHLAVMDEVYKHSGTEIDSIDNFHNHELTHLYEVTGFKIKGSKGGERIILKGKKDVSSAGGWMEIKTPEVTMDNLSGYVWYQELKEAADNAREEVALYREGKYTPVEETTDDMKDQPTLFGEDNAADQLDEELEKGVIN